MEHRLGELARPYHQGKARRYSSAAKALTAAGLAVLGRAGRSRAGGLAGGAALLGGSFCTRFAVYHAGFESARDPRPTIEPQRARLEP
jgi:hypothetical protein